MSRSIVLKVIVGVATTLTAIIATRTYVVQKADDRNSEQTMKKIVFELAEPGKMKRYISDWIHASAVNPHMRLGTIEDEPVTVTITRGPLSFAFESELITIDIDESNDGSVEKIFIASKAMSLDHAVSAVKKFLLMLRVPDERLMAWTKGALAWNEHPSNWPADTPTPLDSTYDESIRLEGKWYEFEIRGAGDDAKPWRITLRTGPSH